MWRTVGDYAVWVSADFSRAKSLHVLQWKIVEIVMPGPSPGRTPAAQETKANIGAERLGDILTNVMEGMAGMGVKHISIATQVALGQVEIRLSSRERMDSAAFGKRRLDLYNRTLGWLGGSFECIKHEDSADFIIRLPVLKTM
jgi:hypothetical protein